MRAKVTPLDDKSTVQHGGTGKRGRRSRVFKAVYDAYEFNGWTRMWLAVVWFVLATTTISYRYPSMAGTYHSNVKALMTSYTDAGGNTADVRSQSTFYGGLGHALGFLTSYAAKADNEGQPEGTLRITEYDRILFARLAVDFKSNCGEAYQKMGFYCYSSGIDPATGNKLGSEELERLAGAHGFRRTDLLDPNVTRAELFTRVNQVLSNEMLFLSTYGFRASLEIGVVNSLAERFVTVYLFTVSRKSNDAIGSQSLRSVVTLIDNVNVRDTPLYITNDDYRRAVLEVISLLFLLKAVWDEVLQFNVCRAWRNLHLSEERRAEPGSARRRALHLFWFFFAQPWNLLDLFALLNFLAWWIMYVVLLAWSFHLKVDSVRSLRDFDEVRSYADMELQHLVWGVFTALLVGLRVLPHFKSHAGLNVYSATLQLSWQRLKDLVAFFGYVYFLMIVLIQPLFEVTGANTLFKDTGTGILNVWLMTFQYLGFQEYFADNAPTFGSYWLIFMFFFWVVVLIAVVISQNVLLALVASAYEESREAVGASETTQIQYSLYRLTWIVYSRWHRWLLRKSPHTLVQELLAATSRPDVWFYQHIFVRWALADLPETKLLAQLYTDPASEILYLYSPWAWHRSSPWDTAQQSPWDEQLDYPTYSWEDVPMNEPGVCPRLRRMPPLFSRNPPDGRPAARGRLPVSYSEAEEIFALTEEEVDDLLEVTGWCWGRMSRYPLVARFSGMGWSEAGRKLLREGLLEVYRRHSIHEYTSTTVGDVVSGGGGGALVAGDEPSMVPPVKAGSTTSQSPLLPPPTTTKMAKAAGGAGDAAAAAAMAADDAAAAVMQRNRAFSLFNRRGRIAENLDLLWGEVLELRQQQAEIKSLLLQLLQQQQQQRSPSSGPVVVRSASRDGGGGGGGGGPVMTMRGAASLAADRPA